MHIQQKEKLTGLILIGCIVVSLIGANSPLSGLIQQILEFKIPVGIGKFNLEKTVEHWINDGLMTVFFLTAGLEIKREMMVGELSSAQKASLPVFAALGGMAMPALIYLLFNYNNANVSGWAIPMATDIAFAIGIMALAGKYVPRSLKIFLVALAIVDDIGAILIIAFFYSTSIEITYLLMAGATLVFLIILNRMQVKHLVFYILPGIALWYFVYMSGIHATIAGVLLAFTIPFKTKDGTHLVEKLEHAIQNPVYFFVLPLFALINTAIVIHSDSLSHLVSPLGFGIICGLFIGKPVGILIVTFIAIKLKVAQLPIHVSWLQITGAGVLAGIGFTMSIFISLLSFSNQQLIEEAKISILIASVFAAVAGFMILKSAAVKTTTH